MKRIFGLVLTVCLLCLVTGCGGAIPGISTTAVSTVDYGDAESFEAALNAGENLEGKIVRFTVKEFHPQSKWGYNLWAGEHLNFVSTRNPDLKVGDEAVVKAATIESIMGSWKITYEKVPNAVDDEHTVYTSEEDANLSEINSSSGDGSKKDHEGTGNPSASVSQGKVEEIDGSFTSNQYYDVVEEGTYTSSGYTSMIYKVLAKQNITMDAQMLAYSPEGNVIGKSSSDITLTEGEYNYFKFMFDSDVADATFEASVKAQDTHSDGDRNAIEMVDYNVSGDDLYITFRQVSDNPGTFAKYKILFYSGEQIVGDEEGFFSVYADNLSGKDSTDVAKIWVYGKTFDRIEYMYEP